MRNTAAGIQFEIAKGAFRPHTALTNMALAYYQNAANYFAKALFPTCPVSLSSDNYYEFSKEDLLRDPGMYSFIAVANCSMLVSIALCFPLLSSSGSHRIELSEFCRA